MTVNFHFKGNFFGDGSQNFIYHVALFLHGGDIQNPSKLLRQIKAKWFKYGRVWVPKKKLKTDRGCFYYIDKNNHDEERAETIHRLSYLAKTRGTGYKDAQAKNYSVSRLNTALIIDVRIKAPSNE